MAQAIEDVSSLPGETVHDQEGRKFGEVEEIYAVGDGEAPMWVTVKTSTGIGRSRLVFIPIARLKQENDEIRAPYSLQHLRDAPEVESDELSEEDDRALRGYYAIGLGDQGMVDAAQSYASQVHEEGPAQKVDASSVEGPARELDEREPGEAAQEAYDADREREGDEEDGDKDGGDAPANEVLGGGEESKDDGESGGEEEAKESEDD